MSLRGINEGLQRSNQALMEGVQNGLTPCVEQLVEAHTTISPLATFSEALHAPVSELARVIHILGSISAGVSSHREHLERYQMSPQEASGTQLPETTGNVSQSPSVGMDVTGIQRYIDRATSITKPSEVGELAAFGWAADRAADYQHAFELALNLSVQDSSQAEAIASNALASSGVNQILGDAITKEVEKLSVEDFRETGLSMSTVCGVLEASLAATNLLEEVAARLQERQNTSEPLSDLQQLDQQILAQDLSAIQSVQQEILIDTGESLEQLADIICLLVGAEALDTIEGRKAVERLDSRAEALAADNNRNESVELLLQMLRDPVLKDMIPNESVSDLTINDLVPRIAKGYRDWRKVRGKRSSRPAVVTIEPPAQAEKGSTETEQPSSQGTATDTVPVTPALDQLSELAQLVELHNRRSKEYRPTWAQLKQRYRDLELAMRRNLPAGEQEGGNFDTARRRLIGLMAVLAATDTSGSQDPEQQQIELQERLANIFGFERTIDANIRKVAQSVEPADAAATTRDWQPIEADMELLHANWADVRKLVVEHWPQSDVQKAVTTISNSLRAFEVYRKELSRPEHHLKTIATHIGATVLRPEARIAGERELAKTRQYRAMHDVLDKIINDEQIQKNDRQRAEVIKYFLAGNAQSQQSAGDTPYGELFYIPPTQEQVTPYFCATFHSESGAEWVLIESLRYGKASYAFPQALIEQQGGSLQDFLDIYTKSELINEGAIKIRHDEGWSALSHIEHIKLRIAETE